MGRTDHGIGKNHRRRSHARRIGAGTPVGRPDFVREIEFFLRACPGPPVASQGLRIAALQPVVGIPGLEDGWPEGTLGGTGAGARLGDGYLRTIDHVARVFRCRPAYLSESSKTHGYSYREALRWIRFLHGRALCAEGVTAEEVVRRLRFRGSADMSRFTRRLIGKTSRQCPTLPLGFWVRMGVQRVFPRTRETER